MSSQNLALRGSQLRNTAWVLGLVVYAGKDTKMARNSKPTPTKQSTIDRQVNRAMGIVFAVQVTVVSLSCVLGVIWTANLPTSDDDVNASAVSDDDDENFTAMWYLTPTPRDALDSIYLLPYPLALWIQFLILYNNFIPISL